MTASSSERLEKIGPWLWCLFLGLAPLFLRPLWEPDEARYAEIPREMLATGDWLTPHLHGVLYFEKPPLQYWLSALSMGLFGEHAWAARLPLLLAFGLSFWCARRLALRLGAREPFWAGVAATGSLLGFVVGQILSLDALFSAFVVLCLTAFVEFVWMELHGHPTAHAMAFREGEAIPEGLPKKNPWPYVAFSALALAVLTKGIAALVLMGGLFLGSLAWNWRRREIRQAHFTLLTHGKAWALFLLLSVPWFVLVNWKNPGHAWFFFIHEHFVRFSSHAHQRQGSSNWFLDKTYFVGILAVGMLPWLSTAILGLHRSLKVLIRPRGPVSHVSDFHTFALSACVLGILWPLAFFSLSGSKLPPYILPSVVPLSALAVAMIRESEVPACFRRSGIEWIVLAGLLGIASLFSDRIPLPWMLVGVLILLGLWPMLRWAWNPARWMGAQILAFAVLAWTVHDLMGPSKSVAHLIAQAPANAQWISFGNLYQGISFYSKTLPVFVNGTSELAFGRDRLPEAQRSKRFIEEAQRLNETARRMKTETPERPIYVLADQGAFMNLGVNDRMAWKRIAESPTTLLLQWHE